LERLGREKRYEVGAGSRPLCRIVVLCCPPTVKSTHCEVVEGGFTSECSGGQAEILGDPTNIAKGGYWH